MKIRAIQYVDGFIKYDEVYEVYEGYEYDEIKDEMEELKGAAFDDYDLEIIND